MNRFWNTPQHANMWSLHKVHTIQGCISFSTCNIILKAFLSVSNFYETLSFITMFRTARHCTLSWASWTQTTFWHEVSLTAILILFSYLRLGLPSSLFPSGCPSCICTFISSMGYISYPSHLLLFQHPKNIWWSFLWGSLGNHGPSNT